MSEVVTKAIASSPQVRRVLRRIRKNPDIDLKRSLAILLKVQSKQEAKKKPTPAVAKTPRKRTKRAPKQKPVTQYIDGRRLTENEITFEEFCRDRFDSAGWLRHHGLSIDGGESSHESQ